MIDITRAFIWLEMHLARRYRFALIAQIVQFLVFLFIFSRLPLETQDGFDGMSYLQFVMTGLVYQIFYEAIMNGPTSRLNELQMTGQLQLVLLAPHPRWLILFAAGAASVIAGVFRAVVVFVAGSWMFGEGIVIESWASLLAAVAYGTALCGCLALINVAGALLWPRVNLTSFFSSLILGLLSGVFIPIDRLPQIIQPLANANPLRWGLDLFRSSLGHHAPIASWSWLPALAAVVLLGGLAIVAYRRADHVLTRDNRYHYF